MKIMSASMEYFQNIPKKKLHVKAAKPAKQKNTQLATKRRMDSAELVGNHPNTPQKKK